MYGVALKGSTLTRLNYLPCTLRFMNVRRTHVSHIEYTERFYGLDISRHKNGRLGELVNIYHMRPCVAIRSFTSTSPLGLHRSLICYIYIYICRAFITGRVHARFYGLDIKKMVVLENSP